MGVWLMRPSLARAARAGSKLDVASSAMSVTVVVALLVCLIPTTIGGLLSAIGIAGIDRKSVV